MFKILKVNIISIIFHLYNLLTIVNKNLFKIIQIQIYLVIQLILFEDYLLNIFSYPTFLFKVKYFDSFF